MTRLSYKQHPPDGDWDAIVIGSGIGGLCAAALLSRYGNKRVCVLERHSVAGGYTHVFKRRGYEWDVGIHYIGEVDEKSVMGHLFDVITDGQIKWETMPACYDRIVLGDRSFNLVAGRKNFVESLVRDFPDSREDIEAYLALMDKVSKATPGYFAYQLLPIGVRQVVAPLVTRKFRQFSDQTVEEALRPIIKDPVLFDVLTGQCGDYGLTPREASLAVHTMVVMHYIEGAYYPVGGPATIADGTETVIGESDGAIYTNAEVSEILLEGKRAVGVRMADGKELRAKIVISDAGVPATYRKLLPKDVAEKTGVPAKLRGIGPSAAHLCLHLGFTETAEELGLDGTNIWAYAPGDREENFAHFAADSKTTIPFAYLSFPSAKDPTFQERYPGKATIEIIIPAQMEWFEEWADTKWKKRGDAYEAWKAAMSERMLEILFAHCPQLEGKVDYQELSTPLSTRHFTGHEAGEMYGLTHTPERFRAGLRVRSGVPGLFLAGADVSSCGVAGALFGGVLAAGAALEGKLAGLILRHITPGLAAKAEEA